MTDFTIDDMINSAIESKPDTFKDAFNNLMAAKVAKAVEDRKIEVAQNMFSDEDSEQEEQSDSDDLDFTDDQGEELETNETEVENATDSQTGA